MTSAFSTTSAYRASILRSNHREHVVELLSRDVARNLFMLSWAENYGMASKRRNELFHFSGVWDREKLVGVALVITNRLALIESVDRQVSSFLGCWYRERGIIFEHIVSARESVEPFWEAYAGSPCDIPVRLNRHQKLFELERVRWMDRLESDTNTRWPTGVRLATHEEIDPVFLASARMHAEETLEDPLQKDPGHFRRHVEHRIATERTYVWFDPGSRLVFKADVSAQSRFGAQISGVYTPPQFRGQGIATRAMHDVCDHLFKRGFPRVTLYVNQENAPALKVYDRVGFEYHCAYQTIFVQ